MGNGLVRRYKPEEEDIHNNWRKPKARPKRSPSRNQSTDQAKAVPEEISHNQWRQPKVKEVQGNAVMNGSSATSTTASGNSNNPAGFMNWQMASAVRDTSPVSMGMMGMDDADDDDADCANLADAAAKVWEDLMVKREATKDFGALFYLGELKDGVERAAKRVEVLRREVNVSSTLVEEKERGLSELCSRIEEKLLPNTNTQWKLGDMAIRRGKGLCELSVVHHEAFPPYYEVRMIISGSVVGTEASNLLELPSQQKSLVRSSLKDLEKARAKLSPLDESLTQAQEELKRQHQALTDQVEKKLRDNSTAATSSPPQSGASPASPGPGPALGAAPPGLPDLNTVKRWGNGKVPGEASVPPVASADYPDMRGSREDTRVESPSTTPTGAPPVGGGLAGANAAVPPQTGPRVHAPTTPVGFPSVDELNRVEEQKAAERARQQASATAASQHPGAQPSANREAFQRADPTQKGRTSLHAGRPAASQTPDPGPVPRANSTAPEPGIPAGFPRLDPTSTNSQDHSSQHRPTQQPQQQQQSHAQQTQQQQQQQQPHQQQQQQQQPYQQAPPAAAAAAEWVVYRTAEGCPYYHNERTNETVWQLPMGARYREPGAAPTAQGADATWQQEPQQQAEEDPFADLRKREEEMKQQREHWAQWYAQYCQWYSQQAQQQAAAGAAGGVPGGGGIPAGAPPPHGGQRHQAPPHFGSDPSGPGQSQGHGQQQGQSHGQGQGIKLPPKGPAPPTLDAGFEDQATYAIKSSVLKEMEAMVAKGAPLAQRKKALRCLHLRWHPDKNPDKLEVAKNVFQFIEETKPWFLHDPDGEESGVT